MQTGSAALQLLRNTVMQGAQQQTKTYLSFDRFPLTVNDCVWRNNAVGSRVSLNDLKLYSPHATSHEEDVALLDGTVGLQKVWLQVYLKEVAGKQNSNILNILSAHKSYPFKTVNKSVFI